VIKTEFGGLKTDTQTGRDQRKESRRKCKIHTNFDNGERRVSSIRSAGENEFKQAKA
jgi:hypothetical protein